MVFALAGDSTITNGLGTGTFLRSTSWGAPETGDSLGQVWSVRYGGPRIPSDHRIDTPVTSESSRALGSQCA